MTEPSADKSIKKGFAIEREFDILSEDVSRFAELSGDRAPLHLDAEFARQMGFNDPIAHGALLIARLSSIIGNDLPGRFGVLQSIDIGFRSPVIPPERVRISVEVEYISPSTGQIIMKTDCRGANGRRVFSGRVKSVIRQPKPNNEQ